MRPKGYLTHEQARMWLAERIDWPLDRERADSLEAHLAGCPDCRAVDREHEDVRLAFRELAQPIPPRDLPARTLAALDAETRHVRPRAAPSLGPTGRRHGTGVVFASLASVMLVAAVGALLIGPATIPGPTIARATPFPVEPEQLAYLGVRGNQVTIVRTRLDRACPSSDYSCANLDAGVSQLVSLPPETSVTGLAMDPGGMRAAVAGQSGGRTTIYVMDLSILPTALGPTSSPVLSTLASQSTEPTPSPSSPTPSATSSPTPRRSATPEVTKKPTASPKRSPGSTASHKAGASARASATPANGDGPVSSASPSSTAIVPPSVPPVVASAGASGPAATLPPVDARPILTDVIQAGMPAAWSSDGSTLAFSAMPADGSHGPDIYTWQPGQPVALPLTTDHASLFASWNGTRIVGSTIVDDVADPIHPIATSFVIDPVTAERRPIHADGLWLPSVDPTGRYFVAWRGTIVANGLLAGTGDGNLIFGPWVRVDPWATPEELAAADASGSASIEPTIIPTPTASTREQPEPSATESASPSSTPAPTPLTSPELVEPSLDPLAPTIADWLVEWSPNGSAFGLWTGTQPGSDDGSLQVLGINQDVGAIDRTQDLLSPTPARRAFSIGLGRVAWTTPKDALGHSDLRIVVWGTFGRGEIRSRDAEQPVMVPAF